MQPSIPNSPGTVSQEHRPSDSRRQIAPLHLCALTLQPHRSPVASPDGTIFDAPIVSRHLSRTPSHPLNRTPLTDDQLIPLCFSVHHQSGRYMCPILRRPFDFADKVVAIATSGNVFSYAAVQRLNLRPRCMTDLLDGSPFTLDDIVVLYDPALHRFSQAPHRPQLSAPPNPPHVPFDPVRDHTVSNPVPTYCRKPEAQQLSSSKERHPSSEQPPSNQPQCTHFPSNQSSSEQTPSNQPPAFSHPRIQPMLPSVDAVDPLRNRASSSHVLLPDALKLAPLNVPPIIPSLISNLSQPSAPHNPPTPAALPSTPSLPTSSQFPSISPASTSLSPYHSTEKPPSTNSSAPLHQPRPMQSNSNPGDRSEPPPPLPPPAPTSTSVPSNSLPSPAETVELSAPKRTSGSSSEPPQLASAKKKRRGDGTSATKDDNDTTEPPSLPGASSKGSSSKSDKRHVVDDRRAVYRRVRKGRKGKGYVRVVTNIGHLNIELHCDKVPLTCDNFLTLAERRYYDGLQWHRVVPGFIAQTGDPTGSGDCGESAWGGYIKDEIRTSLNHDAAGVVSMANGGGRDTNRSQWFVCFDAAPHLDGSHSVFGKVVGGLYVLKKMEAEASMGHPLTVERIEVLVNPIRLAREQIQAERAAAAKGGDAAVAAIAAGPMPLGVLPPAKPSKERRSSTDDNGMDHNAPIATVSDITLKFSVRNPL